MPHSIWDGLPGNATKNTLSTGGIAASPGLKVTASGRDFLESYGECEAKLVTTPGADSTRFSSDRWVSTKETFSDEYFGKRAENPGVDSRTIRSGRNLAESGRILTERSYKTDWRIARTVCEAPAD